jgi:hypothetical protein
MSFELTIKCSKDIDNIHIDFSDGTTIVTSSTKFPKEKKSLLDNNYLNTDENFDNIQQEIIKPPKIEELDRSVKIAEELQNIDI